MYMESKYWLATDTRSGGKVILKQINKMHGQDEQEMMSVIKRKVQNELDFPG